MTDILNVNWLCILTWSTSTVSFIRLVWTI